MERKPNENAAEAPDDSLFTSATRVQIPLGTPDNPLKSQESAESSPASVAGDRGGDSGGLDSNVDAILDVAAVFELINPYATDVPSRIRQLLTLSDEVRRLRETIRVMSTNEGKLHAKIAELETERARLRRIEAVHTCGGGPTPCGGCCECLERTYPEPHEHQRMSAKIARVEADLDYDLNWMTGAFGKSELLDSVRARLRRALKG